MCFSNNHATMFKRRRATSYGRRTRRRLFRSGPRRSRRGTRGRGTRSIKRIALSLAEKKVKTVSLSPGAMNHNTIHEMKLIDNSAGAGVLPEQGDDDNKRIGKMIYSSSITYRGVLKIPYDRRNLCVKAWLVEYNSVDGVPTTYNHWFNNASGSVMLDSLSTDRFKAKLLCTKRLPARDLWDSSTPAGVDASMYVNFNIPFKRTLSIPVNATTVCARGMKENLSIIFTVYDTTSALNTDTLVTDTEGAATLYFRDP